MGSTVHFYTGSKGNIIEPGHSSQHDKAYRYADYAALFNGQPRLASTRKNVNQCIDILIRKNIAHEHVEQLNLVADALRISQFRKNILPKAEEFLSAHIDALTLTKAVDSIIPRYLHIAKRLLTKVISLQEPFCQAHAGIVQQYDSRFNRNAIKYGWKEITFNAFAAEYTALTANNLIFDSEVALACVIGSDSHAQQGLDKLLGLARKHGELNLIITIVNHIKYYAAHGTALQASLANGFINQYNITDDIPLGMIGDYLDAYNTLTSTYPYYLQKYWNDSGLNDSDINDLIAASEIMTPELAAE